LELAFSCERPAAVATAALANPEARIAKAMKVTAVTLRLVIFFICTRLLYEAKIRYRDIKRFPPLALRIPVTNVHCPRAKATNIIF
jgi:amino acid permease